MKTDISGALSRTAGSVLLWTLAIIGALSGLLWAAGSAGLVKTLIVASGSMAPAIDAGDLLLATPTTASDLEVGDVATLPSADGTLVTHRIIELDRSGDAVTLRMQGDANPTPDATEHTLAAGDRVWTPQVTIPGAGAVVQAVSQPIVFIPFGLGVAALLVLTMAPPRRAAEVDATIDEDAVDALLPAEHVEREKVSA